MGHPLGEWFNTWLAWCFLFRDWSGALYTKVWCAPIIRGMVTYIWWVWCALFMAGSGQPRGLVCPTVLFFFASLPMVSGRICPIKELWQATYKQNLLCACVLYESGNKYCVITTIYAKNGNRKISIFRGKCHFVVTLTMF